MAAEDVFRLWHDKEPRREYSRKVALLDEAQFVRIGSALVTNYTSDKWEADGHVIPYTHDHDQPYPGVFVPLSRARESDMIGSPKSTRSLLGMRTAKGTFKVAQLGIADTLVYLDVAGSQCELNFGGRTLLLSTPDKKCLIILHGKKPILVRGGKMRVTKRGIVG